MSERCVCDVTCRESNASKSGKKKEHKLKLLGPDIFRWGGGLPREGVGAKKFSMSIETQGEDKHLERDRRTWLKKDQYSAESQTFHLISRQYW